MTNDVLLVGAARSGTKWLRSVLSASAQIREIPFDVNFIWRTGQHAFAHDRLEPSSATPARVARIRHKLYAAAGCTQDSVFLEKTVSNTMRVPFVREVFPQGKYVHLLRDGRNVIESSYRQWLAKPDYRYLLGKLKHFPLDDWQYAVWFLRNTFLRKSGQPAIWGPRYAGIEQDVSDHGVFLACCLQWVKSVEWATNDLQALPAHQVMTVKYENLVQGGDHLHELIDFLGIADGASVLDHHRRTVQTNLSGKWRDNLSPEQIGQMMEVVGPTLARLGYAEPASRP